MLCYLVFSSLFINNIDGVSFVVLCGVLLKANRNLASFFEIVPKSFFLARIACLNDCTKVQLNHFSTDGTALF